MKYIINKLRERRNVRLISESGAFDEVFYRLQLGDLGLDIENPIEHYVKYGSRSGIRPHRFFDCKDYVRRHADVSKSGMDPFVHFIKYGANERRFFSYIIHFDDYICQHPDFNPQKENILAHYNKLHRGSVEGAKRFLGAMTLLEPAARLGYFDHEWYEKRYQKKFFDAFEAFEHYNRVSKFSPVNPSPKFDSAGYFRSNLDVYYSFQGPLEHFINFGKDEGRIFKPEPVFTPAECIKTTDVLSLEASQLTVAFCLHIFYEDYVEIFSKALENFPLKIDLFIAASTERVSILCQEHFAEHQNVSKLEIKVVPNRGRNFGPMLVEFGEALKEYDVFCHLHSKKSLYSGREQTQWARYLIEYMVNDTSVTTRVLNAFSQDEHIGIYYPTTFWLMPSWVNHVLQNRAAVNDWARKLSITVEGEFLAYPVGGMFWGRPKALKQLLAIKHRYDDFPDEPLANDGTMLHGLERIVGSLAESNGYRQIFYYPQTGDISFSKSYIFQSYTSDFVDLERQVRLCEYVSFDVFDTLVSRRYSVPDYAKLKLGKELSDRGFVRSPTDFVSMRNEVEANLRAERSYVGDLTLSEIYERLSKVVGFDPAETTYFKQREFELDFEMICPKEKIVDLCNELIAAGRAVWIISDTYYEEDDMRLILQKAGVSGKYRLFISSKLGFRKDNSTMWNYVDEQLKAAGSPSYIHIGDNVVADSQRPGDLGLRTLHVLNPFDKWIALGFPDQIRPHTLDEKHIIKWGALVNRVGRFPWL